MQRKITVLLLGANASVASSLLRRHQHTYTILYQECNENSLSTVGEQHPHIVIFACDKDDLCLCQRIRQKWPTVSILILSENGSEQQITRALDLGADDYITIPFGKDEFLARIRALLRRMQMQPADLTYCGPDPLVSQDGKIVLSIARHRCTLAGCVVRLTATEFKLLRVMMMHSGKVLSHRFLLQQVWGPEYGEETGYLRIYLHQLRGKIEPDPAHPHYIVTEPGVGYIFKGYPT